MKQSTIAVSCGLSLSTVKRALNTLSENGLIVNRYRVTRDNGYQGCYHYTLAIPNKYFFMRSDILSFALSSREFKLYALMCKLRSNKTNSFYQSLNDLCALSNLSKSDLCRTINLLADKFLIAKQCKRTSFGDFTDNTYFVIGRFCGRIKQKTKRKLFEFISDIIIPQTRNFVNCFLKLFANVHIRGSG